MVLLKLSPIISPDLLDALYRMGHGDEIVFADAHFPGESIARRHSHIRLIRADGIKIPDLLRAVLPLFPLDTFDGAPLKMMSKVEGDTTDVGPTMKAYGEAIEQGCAGKKEAAELQQDWDKPEIEMLYRFAFYEQATKAYAIVMTGETAKYGNIVLKKGVVY